MRFVRVAKLLAAFKKLIKEADKACAFYEATQLAGFTRAEALGFFGKPPAGYDLVIEPLPAPVAHQDDARHRREVRYQVTRDVRGRDEFDFLGADGLHAGGHAGGPTLALRLHGDLPEFQFPRLQRHVDDEPVVPRQVQRVGIRLEADERGAQGIPAGADAGQQVEAVRVGDGAVEPAA